MTDSLNQSVAPEQSMLPVAPTDPVSVAKPTPAPSGPSLTVAGVCAMIEKIAAKAIATGETSTPVMTGAMESVLKLLDGHATRNAPLASALSKVREACGLTKPTTAKDQK